MLTIYRGDNLSILPTLTPQSFDLIYIDPPFNTGRRQARTRIRAVRDERGDRTGYQGRRYRTVRLATSAFEDSFGDYLAFLEPRLREAYRLLSPAGSFFFHIDYREVHYCKVLLDGIFGRRSFLNEIVWAYDYGARSRRRWSPKHDNILFYAKDPQRYTYRYEDIDRIPYLAPGLVGPEKAARGKTPTDTWWHTVVSPNGREKTGYPTRKPLAILECIVRVHSSPGDRVLDFFAGSGTTGEAAVRNGRHAVLIDDNAEAIRVMKRRLAIANPRYVDALSPCEGAAAKVPQALEGGCLCLPSPTGRCGNWPMLRKPSNRDMTGKERPGREAPLPGSGIAHPDGSAPYVSGLFPVAWRPGDSISPDRRIRRRTGLSMACAWKSGPARSGREVFTSSSHRGIGITAWSCALE